MKTPEERKEEFIKKAIKKHGNKYDYSKVIYVGSKTDVCIICPEHGEFWQSPAAHVRGNQCPKCANERRRKAKEWTKEIFIGKAKGVHGNKYDYSKVVYTGSDDPVCIVCPTHGEFWQTPASHVFGRSGCPKCKHRGLTRDEMIEEFRRIHGNKYDYSKFVLGKMDKKAVFICPEHGDFEQTPTKHLRGHGCQKCGKRNAGLKNRITNDDFISRAKAIHGDKYDFSKTIFTTFEDKVDVICKKHGIFSIKPYDLLDGHGCSKCANLISNPENELYNFICGLVGAENVKHNDRSVLGNGKEIDIYVPSKRVGFEYNGLYWHSERTGKGKWYHYDKMKRCEDVGVRLIQIFEDEYQDNKDIVFDKIRYILKTNVETKKIPARKCSVHKVDYAAAKEFLVKNHIQGVAKSTLYLAAYYEGEVMGVMTFLKEAPGKWILNRYATKVGTICQGLGGKMFTYFTKNYNPEEVKSFADRRWSSEGPNLYERIGFNLDGKIDPDYRYIFAMNPKRRIHKFNFRKRCMEKRGEDIVGKTEKEIAKNAGYEKVWDCGLLRYVWKKGDV